MGKSKKKRVCTAGIGCPSNPTEAGRRDEEQGEIFAEGRPSAVEGRASQQREWRRGHMQETKTILRAGVKGVKGKVFRNEAGGKRGPGLCPGDGMIFYFSCYKLHKLPG